ncbi:hypothetical protein IEQ34_019370 [Dendrobium chrysotoxum]|nr:hypothetical protein IEQ34_019370 [Dendrobium chrysotoxum]
MEDDDKRVRTDKNKQWMLVSPSVEIIVERSHTQFPLALLLPMLCFSVIHPLTDNSRETRKREREMSSRRGNSRSITDDEINELISKLQSLLPESRRRNTTRASASKLLKETCSYIRSLHREVEDLSERLSELMASMDSNSAQAEIIRSLLRSS